MGTCKLRRASLSLCPGEEIQSCHYLAMICCETSALNCCWEAIPLSCFLVRNSFLISNPVLFRVDLYHDLSMLFFIISCRLQLNTSFRDYFHQLWMKILFGQIPACNECLK